MRESSHRDICHRKVCHRNICRPCVRIAAFTLTEMMAVIAMLSLFLLLAGPLFSRAMRVTRQAHDAIELHQTAQGLFHMLRADIRDARKVTLTSDTMVTIESSAEGTITWTIELNHSFTRLVQVGDEAPSTAKRWSMPAQSLRFEWSQPTLRVIAWQQGRLREASFHSGWLITMPSKTAAASSPAVAEKEQP